ncbi:MAG: hypothetical protein NTV36_02225, partial [Candidatus Staskawiczbacteria bacterium]|nr:hypothetical protein [Candidatus Staskawiczbacteria bacterium]
MNKVKFLITGAFLSMAVVLFSLILTPAIAQASTKCNETYVPSTTVSGIKITTLSNTVVNGTNTLLLELKNLESTEKTVGYATFSCRCKEHLGDPNQRQGWCGEWWPERPNLSGAGACNVAENLSITLPANGTKNISITASQYQNQSCGSFQLDLSLKTVNGVTLNTPLVTSASFTDMCTDCQIQAPACSKNTDCGTNGLSGNPFCKDGDVYKKFKTFTCNNAGTANASCSNAETDQKVTDCTANQTCSGDHCVDQNIECNTNSECGINGLTGDQFCFNGDAYRKFRAFTCNNPGTVSSSCSHADTNQLIANCTSGQTCSGGSCMSVNCSTNSDCGTNGLIGDAFCKNGDVYKKFRTFTCNNAGTSNSSCSHSDADQKTTDCTTNQTCSGDHCVDNNQNTLNVSCYASPSSINQNQSTTFIATATGGSGSYGYSWAGACTSSGQTCSNSFSQTGTQTATINVTSGSETKSANCSVNVNQNNNNNNNISVQTNSATNVYSNQATLNGYLYAGNNNNCTDYVWFQYGTSTSYGSETSHQSQSYSGAFSQNVYNLFSGSTYHYRAVAQDCSGNTVYGQDMTIYSNNTNGNLTATKTVRNLTNGSGFSSSTSANPGDVLMFMITLQATGNQNVQNV